MKNKLKKISIITLLLVIVISLTSSCFAVDASTLPKIVINGEEYILSLEYMGMKYDSLDLDNWDNYVVLKDEQDGNISNYKVCFFSSNSIKFTNSVGDFTYGLVSCSGKSGFCRPGKLYTFNLDPKTKKGSLGWGSTDILDNYKFALCDVDDIVLSTFDIYSKENNDELVFQKTPVGVQSTLVPIVQEVPLEGVLQEIVETLPVVLITLVGLIGLHKALALLSQILHKA